MGLRTCISNKSPGDTEDAGPAYHYYFLKTIKESMVMTYTSLLLLKTANCGQDIGDIYECFEIHLSFTQNQL